ncbi:MAG: DMT family transporter [Bacteroidia bacterium]|nr:DMT family transporter [Bacteroidia bacterium]
MPLKEYLENIPPKIQAWVLILVLTFVWGSSFIMLKKALVVFTPLQVVSGRMTFAAITLLPFALRELKNIPGEKWKYLILFSVIANIFTTLSYAVAQSQIDSALNGIINTLTPLMTLIVGLLAYKQKLNRMQALGLLLGLAATLFLLRVSGNAEIGYANFFVLVSVFATVLNGFTANMLQFNLRGLSALQIASVAFLLILPLSGTLLLTGEFFPLAFEVEGGMRAMGFVLILGIFANAIALILLSYLVQISGSVFATLTTYLMPLVAISWGAWDGEQISYWQILAMGLILCSVYLVNRAGR